MRDSLTPRLRWATGIAVGLDGYNLTVVTASLIALTRQFHLSDFATIELALGTLFGSLLGGILAGTLTDHVGRLKVFTYDLWFLSSSASHRLFPRLLEFCSSVGFFLVLLSALTMPLHRLMWQNFLRAKTVGFSWGLSGLCGPLAPL